MENTQTKPAEDARVLLCDKEVARRVAMSPQWVRQQRHRRRKGLPHSFTVDAILLGSSPRYSVGDLDTWLASLPKG